jgi:hypothetical protein
VRQRLRDALVVIEIGKTTGSPLQLVEAAVAHKATAEQQARRERDENLRYDHVWCVLDVDSHASLDAAVRLGNREGISLAVSNPCFELWLLLHFQDHTAHVTAAGLVSLLRSHISGYDKHVDCALIGGRYSDAEHRADLLVKRHEQNGTTGENPSTSVHELIKQMLAAAERSVGGSTNIRSRL